MGAGGDMRADVGGECIPDMMTDGDGSRGKDGLVEEEGSDTTDDEVSL